jgi:uncharacterized beta-barrel protein YwiB (DUF1934 family)
MTTGEVNIKITGVQIMGEEQDVTVMEVQGDYKKTEDGCVIEYIEKPAEGMEVRNRIVMNSESTVISKSGAVESEMVFTPGKESSVEYKTPFGVIDMMICCEEVIVDEKEYTGEITILYDLKSGEQLVAHCNTKIETEII